jgi:3-oxoacyl-[acyl-carrier-protein] synthase II
VSDQLYITGTGLITPLGNGVQQTWRALLAGEFIRDHARLSKRVTEIAIDAAREAVESASWDRKLLEDGETALVVGTSKGPIEKWMTAPPVNDYRTNKISFDGIGLHEISNSLAHEFQLGFGPRLTLSAACASGLHALIRGIMLIQSGQVKRALIVAAEASVHPLFIGSFKRLGVLPPEGFGCRPFDQNRQGFLISECAAAICLERQPSETDCAFTQIDSFMMTADAYHLTGSDPSAKTLGKMLKRVIGGRPVDLVHAHATGTQTNDPIELAAIEDSISKCQAQRPWLYSHKGALGHSLGAAGLVSIVLNVESHRTGIIPPNVQTHDPLPLAGLALSRQAARAPIRRSVAIASGFGGAMAAVTIKSP